MIRQSFRRVFFTNVPTLLSSILFPILFSLFTVYDIFTFIWIFIHAQQFTKMIQFQKSPHFNPAVWTINQTLHCFFKISSQHFAKTFSYFFTNYE